MEKPLAKFAIAQQNGLATTLVSPVMPGSEPIEALINQGEFPTLVDQGEGQAPAPIAERVASDKLPNARLIPNP
jgi:hypothetical protein